MSSSKSNNKDSSESNWLKFWKALKTIIMALFICILPFAFPILLKLFIHFKIFYNVDEFEKLIKVFSNNYMLVYLIIVIIILLVSFGKSISLVDVLKNFKWKGKIGEKVSVEADPIEPKPVFEVFGGKLDIDSKDTEETKAEIQVFLNNKKGKTKIEEEKLLEIEDLKKNLENVRFFSAYNTTNASCKELLLQMYNDKSIDKKEFIEGLEKYYKKVKKNMRDKKKREEKIKIDIENKIFNYNYLDIIEISDDDKIITLTKNGEKFVEEYLRGVG